jgi:TPR repeat protein
MGIPLSQPAVTAEEAELQDLARHAQMGDKQAQLELGTRYEEGRGVPVDFRRALTLYALAAADSGGTLWLYSPPVGSRQGQVVPVNAGPQLAGLPIARQRLNDLQNRAAHE